MWEKVEEQLKRKHLNQEQLAKRMGVNSGTITDLKKGRIKKPSFQLVCKIADALNISVDELRK